MYTYEPQIYLGFGGDRACCISQEFSMILQTMLFGDKIPSQHSIILFQIRHTDTVKNLNIINLEDRLIGR